jgi:nicotinamidase-related amidase
MSATPSNSQPALLIIDMQKGMVEPRAGKRNNPGAEAAIARALAAWRRAGAPVVHVRHISRTPGSLFWPGQPSVEFQAAFSPRDTEHVVEKNVPDAFINTGLERWLHARGIATVAILGVSTNNSVESTARSSGNLGFRTLVAADGTFAFAKADFDGVYRTAAEVHAMALSNLHGEYATVVTADDLCRLVHV